MYEVRGFHTTHSGWSVHCSLHLPPPFAVLARVQQFKDVNRMDSKNLAVVFTPTIMRSPYNNSGIMAVQKLPEQKKAVDMMITNYHSLFE